MLFFPNDTISLPLPMVDKKVRGLKSSLFVVAILFDTRGRPDGNAASVNYGERNRFKLVCNAHIWPSTSGRIAEVGGAISEVIFLIAQLLQSADSASHLLLFVAYLSRRIPRCGG